MFVWAGVAPVAAMFRPRRPRRRDSQRRCLHVVAVACVCAVGTAVSVVGISAWTALPTGGRRSFAAGLITTVAGTSPGLAGWAGGAACAEEVVYRTKKQAPRIPKVLAVMLLRTTYESVEDWGAYSDMASYQKYFALQIRDGYQSFRDRFRNYDLTMLYNTTFLEASADGGISNRFYFSFLNDAQWRVIGRAVKSEQDRDRFGRVVGDRLYRAIIKGKELKSDVEEDANATEEEKEVARKYQRIGIWPALGKLPKTDKPDEVLRNVGRILGYLKEQGYCESFEISLPEALPKGGFRFRSFVREPANLETTRSLMRSNDNFAPRYDQRILQAFFADCGFGSSFSDSIAGGLQVSEVTPAPMPNGILSEWSLVPDPEAGL